MGAREMVLDAGMFRHHIDFFNAVDSEPIRNAVTNAKCWEWMCENIPWFECPDRDIEQVYYYRWWVLRKHLRRTPSGFVITEFLPDVKHARRHNTIVCAAGLHIEEARWLRDRRYASDYIRSWFSPDGEPRVYSTWLAHALHAYCCATDEWALAETLLGRLVENYRSWEESHQHRSGLFWSCDDRDGGECSISGDGLRPTLNCYMYGDAAAIAALASRVNQHGLAQEFAEKAMRLRQLVQARLWDPASEFFKVLPLDSREDPIDSWEFSTVPAERDVRELYGYLPWKFALPEPGYERAWLQLLDEQGFAAPHGPTTAEQRHPRFMKYRIKRCQWDGPSWPFTTSLTIGALARLLREYKQDVIGRQSFLDLLKTYARSQHRILPYGEEIPWIGENLHPHSGIWLARAIALEGKCRTVQDMNDAVVRGKDYNHSSYCDLVISGLVGLELRDDGGVVIDPLIPKGTWDWFCLDGIRHGNKNLTILYDKTGERYQLGQGLRVLADGVEIGSSRSLSALSGTLQQLVKQDPAADGDIPRL